MLKNKKEREDFINNYQTWELVCDISEVGVKIYKKELKTGAKIYVTEYQSFSAYKKDFRTETKFNLILTDDDTFGEQSAYGTIYYKTYNPSGIGMSILVDYLTKNKLLI